MNRTSSQVLLIFVCALITSASPAAGQILQNGSFESGFAGWTASGNQTILNGASTHPASDGARVVVLAPGNLFSNAVLSQTFATTPGQRYGLAFDVGSVGAVHELRLRVTVTGTGQLVNRVVEFTGLNEDPFYVPQHLSFVANSTSTTLTFADLTISPLLVDAMLDNVRITTEDAQAPLVVSQPQSTAVMQGRDASFTVTASGPGPFAYQWQFNGLDIPSATESSYTVSTADVSEAGNYSVVVTNAEGSVNSSAATLLVVPPAILLNGSFEYGAAAWTLNDIVRVYTTVNPIYEYTDGRQLMHFNYGQSAPGGTMSQSFPTIPGEEYVLTFDFGAFSVANQNQQRVRVRVQGSTGTLLDQTLTAFAPGNGTTYLPSIFNFVADGTAAMLSFEDTSTVTLNVDVVVDNVRVTLPSAAPVITVPPQSLSVNPEESATFTVTATGEGPLSYQWRHDGAPIPGATSSSYTIANVQSSHAGGYDVVVSNYAGSTTSTVALLTVHSPPAITAQPQSAPVAMGSPASLSVTATGASPLSYQWRRNGSQIPGAVASTYAIANVQSGDAGTYDVLVSNPMGSVTSSLATLTVTSGGTGLTNGSFELDLSGWTASGNRTIATNSSSHPASDGAKAVVFNQNDSSTTGMLSQVFATTPGQRYALSFDIGTVGAIADQRLQVIVEGNGILLDQTSVVAGPSAGPFYVPQHLSFVANSASSRVTFLDESYTYFVIDSLLDNVRVVALSSQAPVVTAQPQRTHAVQGASATFTVGASGTGLSYQWHFNGLPIAGATSNSYTVTGAQTGDAGNYSVVISNAAGSVSSSAAVLTVIPPAILLNGSFEFGSAAWTFSGKDVSTSTNINYGVTNGTQLAHFNWGDQPPTGVLSQSFATTPGQAYVLSFDVGAFSIVNQNAQRVRVTLDGNTPLLSQDIVVFAPGNGGAYVPRSFPFVANSATTTLRFRDISQTTVNVDLLLDNVRVTTGQGGPTITSQPQSAAVTPGSAVTFSVTATGQAPLSYQWRLNGTPISGATASSYTIASAQPIHAGGSYDVVVSNIAGSVTSASATLLVVAVGTLANGSFEAGTAGWTATGNQVVVSSSPYVASDGVKAMSFNGGQTTPNGVLTQSFGTTIGQSYTLSLDVGAFSMANQQQQRLQVTVQGNSTLVSQTVSVLAPGNGTSYQPRSFVFVADSAITVLSFRDVSTTTANVDLMLDNVRVTTGQSGPTITSQPQSAAVTPGSAVTFSVTATGQAPLSYQWRLNGTPISGATASSYTIASAQPIHAGGSYDVVVSNIAGSVTSASATLLVVAVGTLANGSFEAGTAGWTATGNQVVVSSSPYVASDGVKAMSFNGGQTTPNGVLTQSFGTTIGQSYTLSLDVGAFSMANQQQQRLQVTVQGNSTLVSQTVSVLAPGNGTSYQPRSFVFVADSAITVLSFRDVSTTTANVDLMLDNVRVTTGQSGPTITSQPQSAAVTPGSAVTFSVTATGQAPLSYQWRLNGTPISGATASSYTIASAQPIHAGGSYDVVVSNIAGSVTSASATLLVVAVGTLANGSFEAGTAGWTATGNQVVVSSSPYVASDGVKAMSFNGGQTTPNGVLTQSFGTTIGQSYTLSLDVGAFSMANQQQQRLQVTVQGNSTLVSQTVSVLAPGNGTSYQPRSFVFVADSAITVLSFRDVSTTTANVDLMLDNVRVTSP